MNHDEAFAGKIAALRSLMGEKKLSALILRRNPNLAWVISGRAHVPTTIDAACFDLVITDNSTYAVTNAIEAPRLAAEEFPHGLEIKVVQWWEGRAHGLPENLAIGSDQPAPGLIDLGIEIEILRASLDEYDRQRIATISSRAAIALSGAMREVSSEDREIDVAARITSALWQHNLEISFLGVAGQARVMKFRHPLPTDALIGNRASASICAKEKGLISSLTRLGNPFSSVIDVATHSYGAHGFDSDEWHRHHQGGPSGFMPRDWPATQASARTIQENQVIAWNPTGKGWKVEETLLTQVGGNILLRGEDGWPTRTIRGRIRPDLLRR
jgi:antitoxin VapB